MKKHGIFLGIFFLLIGVLLLLRSMDVLHFSWCAVWRSVWHLWPLVLVYIGVSLLPIKEQVKIVLKILLLLFAGGYFIYSLSQKCDDCFFNKVIYKNHSAENFQMSVNYQLDENTAVLDIDAGACTVFMQGDSLVDLFSMNGVSYLPFSGTEKVLSLSEKSWNVTEPVRLSLNTRPEWIIDADFGAASMEWDLRQSKIRKIDIDCGVSDIDVKFGHKQAKTDVDIDAGASTIVLHIPANAYCQLDGDFVLIDKELDGFMRTQGAYVTHEHPDTISPAFYIHIESGLGKLKILRDAE